MHRCRRVKVRVTTVTNQSVRAAGDCTVFSNASGLEIPLAARRASEQRELAASHVRAPRISVVFASQQLFFFFTRSKKQSARQGSRPWASAIGSIAYLGLGTGCFDVNPREKRRPRAKSTRTGIRWMLSADERTRARLNLCCHRPAAPFFTTNGSAAGCRGCGLRCAAAYPRQRMPPASGAAARRRATSRTPLLAVGKGNAARPPSVLLKPYQYYSW